MTYLAPRQGFFAAILILSFALHLIFFVVSLDREIGDQNRSIAEKAAVSLTQELNSSMAASDRVSMSVIAEPYVNERAISYVGIYDAKDQVIVPLGSSNGGQQISQVITSGDQVLGRVVVEAEPVSYAKLLSAYWLFVVGAIGLHVLLWFIYGHLARPTDKLKHDIARDVRNDLLSKGLLSPAHYSEAVATEAVGLQVNEDNKPASVFMNDRISELPNDLPNDKDNDSDDADMVANEHIESNYVIKVKYNDPDGLLSTLSIETKQAYFALCDQLMVRAYESVLQMPLFAGVKITEVTAFDDEGACVEIYAENDQAKAAAAAAMLGKLLVTVNQIVYDKHREIRRFALSVRAVCCDTKFTKEAVQLTNQRQESLLVLMSESARHQVASHMTLAALNRPLSVQERDAQMVVDISNSTAERLKTALDKILTENE